MRFTYSLGLLYLCGTFVTTQDTQDFDPYKLAYVPDNQKPRVFVLTDILNEPDDQQSVVRYLLYSNEFNTRALCATTSTHLRNETHPDRIEQIVKAYGQVVKNLNRHVHPWNQYTPAEDLLSLITSGPTVRLLLFAPAPPNLLTMLQSYGREALSEPISEGAQLLIERLQESTEPLWILVWGGPNTLAQALHHLSQNVTDAEFAVLRARLRVYAISDQDDTSEWIRYNWPDIFYIVSIHGFTNYALATWRCMWEGIPSLSLNKLGHEWLAKYIEIGPLGDVYPRRAYGAEGDTPSFLYLIQNGLGDREDPRVGGWGGRWLPINHGSRVYGDSLDIYYAPDGSNETSNKATCARWRDHFQNDMASRMQWSVSDNFSNGTHPPVPRINGTVGPSPIRISVVPGQEVVLDASETFGPDDPENNSTLVFEWYQYLESGYQVRGTPRDWAKVELEAVGDGGETPDLEEANDSGFRRFTRGPSVKVTVPNLEDIEYEYHIILQVTNNKNPELPVRRYMRVKLTTSSTNINPDECCVDMIVPETKNITW
ncbi:hypothetical protein NM208_g1157 [Fusarium decemcellulare]|uniref:Uncharacterized protein n=1 Tax=Fusarium decemcellulare TaxID=57161 RepID=A0ACC1SX29_9HYPO|nr:hypothetical protein NM208_g1157 [Fusarium decemcellulare]